jgi:SAM-dependent methyltransferase
MIETQKMTLQTLEQPGYVRLRLDPKPGDADYLHLSDLLKALELYRSADAIWILDYGCGGSPYRSLFPNSHYRRADFANMANLDYVLDNDCRIDERDAVFDLILSTQVAEHVSDPAGYFAECARLLKLGGTLLCTTPGTYPEHGCPYDFQRWTADGLARDVKAAGLEVDRVLKLTTNGRALFYLMQRFSGWLDSPRVFRPHFFGSSAASCIGRPDCGSASRTEPLPVTESSNRTPRGTNSILPCFSSHESRV